MKEDLTESIPSYSNDELVKLLEQYKTYLFEEYLPFIDNYIYDRENGGYFWNSTYRGKQLSTNKRTWYDARGTWIYSYLYKHIEPNPLYLQRAKQTLGLLFKTKEKDARFWPWSYDILGKDLQEREGDIYGNLFVAEALVGYAEASGDDNAWAKAKEIMLHAFQLYQSEDYRYLLEYSPSADYTAAEEILGHYMIFLHLATSLLSIKSDENISQIADSCLDALIHQHYDSEINLMPELASKSKNGLDEQLTQFVYIGHAIETLWMIMEEAKRRDDQQLFDLAATRFKHHVEVANDRIFGGFFHGIDHVKENRFLLDKVLWAQEEVLVGCLILIEEHKDEWAWQYFNKTLRYLQEHFINQNLPYRPWKINGNRQMNNQEEGKRIENYHHPRHLIFAIQTLERILNRNTLNLNSYEK
ncbi:hypothetical protein GQF61_02690 [Sphingobacterium sp. DK4209]|uniref:N-acylglucosamine 2-epimerase n=1 Tax=Sphingobacterium zhuxiongii TaxID=2662364 RepID=A0A5Q0QAC8_9SPHI|nr:MULTISPECIES: AGE family epimerase/isomerase [unclassified Sphingobacterium]MVZ64747.1 hypothetical protein [Sphingobacterium sp. DK4209]QGA27077.1 hypothetical protein GFH32_12445 [Sphingobacterium sp. dk4302]